MTAKRPPVKPSAKAIESLKPEAVRYETSVAGHRGLIVTVHPTGDRTYSYRGRIEGRLHRERLEIDGVPVTTFAEARKVYGDLAARRRTGVHLPSRHQQAAQERAEHPTVAKLCADYIERHAKPNKRSWQQDARMLAKDVLPAWGKLKADAITRPGVVALLDEITDRGSPMQAGKVLALVRKVWNFGLDRGAVPTNPAARIPRPVKVRAKDRVLSDAELRVFWLRLDESGMRPQVAGALRLQLLTGSRIGEALSVEWSEVDAKAATWLIPAAKSKSKREHLVPLSARALAAIQAQPQVGRYVFPARGKEPKAVRTEVAAHELTEALAGDTAFARAIREAGGQPFTSHDLRRTVETRLASLGIGREVRDRVLNHRDASVSGTHYNRHDYLAEKRAALEAWASLLDGIVSGKAPGKVASIHRARRRA